MSVTSRKSIINPSASTAAWHLPAKSGRSWRAVFLKGLGIGLACLVFAQYLAGFLFLWSVHANTREASPLTIARYGYYYGDRADIRSRLMGSSVVGFGVVLVCALTLLLPRR